MILNAKPKSEATAAKKAKCAATKETAAKKRVVLSVKAEPGSTVYVSGSFNEWDATEKKLVDKRGDGVFTTTLTLAPGLYEYKFVINGIWTLDPDPDRDWTQNGLGTLNSVLRVG
jgi:1,4-alpha-glucan branching enzyme